MNIRETVEVSKKRRRKKQGLKGRYREPFQPSYFLTAKPDFATRAAMKHKAHSTKVLTWANNVQVLTAELNNPYRSLPT